MTRWKNWLVDAPMLLKLSLRLQLGRWAWVVPVIAASWAAFLALSLVFGWFEQGDNFVPVDAQNKLIGTPLYFIAIGLGIRIIAGEIEQHTLEVTYTVPGGAHRVWISKIFAALLPIVAAEIVLAIIAAAFFTPYPISALYGAFQAAVFFLVLAMGLGALLRSEITAALVSAVVLFFNGAFIGFGDITTRLSPFFNPLNVREEDLSNVIAWTIQNRIGYALLIGALYALACVRAERRELLLRA